MLTLGWILISAAAYCAHRALRLDRELRQLLPPVVERRWQTRPDWVRLSLDPEQWFDAVVRFVPARWQRHLHSERGAALADRFWLWVAVAWCVALPGFAMFLAALERPSGY